MKTQTNNRRNRENAHLRRVMRDKFRTDLCHTRNRMKAEGGCPYRLPKKHWNRWDSLDQTNKHPEDYAFESALAASSERQGPIILYQQRLVNFEQYDRRCQIQEQIQKFAERTDNLDDIAYHLDFIFEGNFRVQERTKGRKVICRMQGYYFGHLEDYVIMPPTSEGRTFEPYLPEKDRIQADNVQDCLKQMEKTNPSLRYVRGKNE